MNHADLKARATHRRRTSPFGIGAALDRDVTESDRDGRVWRVLITDTVRGFASIRALLPAPECEEVRDAEEIEAAVERLSGLYPLQERMACLVAHHDTDGPLRIRVNR